MLTNMFFGYSEWKLGVRRLMSAADTLTVGVEETPYAIPERILLCQNYPNPFNPSTTIKYELPRSSMVRLSMYDMLGREAGVLVNEWKGPGAHEVEFDGTNYASGVYVYRLTAGDVVQSRRLMHLKEEVCSERHLQPEPDRGRRLIPQRLPVIVIQVIELPLVVQTPLPLFDVDRHLLTGDVKDVEE